MKRAAATLILALATLFFVGDACDNVPSMDMNEACHKACASHPGLYQLCRTTLDHAAATAEVTVYAIVAAKYAKLSYESTMEAADRLLQNPSLPGDERAAYARCKDRYAEARSHMSGVINELFVCSFAYAVREYAGATVAVASCGNGLAAALRSSPLHAMNAADQDKTNLASYLGALIVGK